MSKYLISIIGPTAIGKTTKSIALAKVFNSEILSADSRQFYKEMNIGTAVPNREELAAVPHHFIQHISINNDYNVGDFEKETLKKLKELFKTHKILFLVGGSGLYHTAIHNGLNEFPKITPGLRNLLNDQLKTEGLESLQKQLKTLDPIYADSTDLDNPHRIIRALEVSISSGEPFSSFLNQKKPKREFYSLKIGLEAPRTLIYNRIEKRVDIMMSSGLLEEAKKLYPQRHKNALNTIGYKELFRYLENDWTLNFAIEEIKKNSRRFAKRQLTWFRKDKDIHWFPYDCPIAEIAQFLHSKIK